MMHPLIIAAIVLVVLAAASALGMWLRLKLPQEHLAAETRDTVRVGMGSVATMAALVLGLLVASTKENYDSERAEVVQMASKIVYLDDLLANLGAEAYACRAVLRGATKSTLVRLWPQAGLDREQLPPGNVWTRELPIAIQQLAPQTEAQRTFKSQAADLANDLGQLRWLLYEQAISSISTPMLVIMVTWVALTFLSVGLFAPGNITSVVAQLFAAISVAGAILLILELDHPFAGMLHISSEPMISALSQLQP